MCLSLNALNPIAAGCADQLQSLGPNVARECAKDAEGFKGELALIAAVLQTVDEAFPVADLILAPVFRVSVGHHVQVAVAVVVVDMKKKQLVSGFAYLPRQDGKTEGMTSRYRLELSANGKDWTTVSEGEFGNLRANPVEQIISFDPLKARYIRFVSTAALDGSGSSAAELRIFGGKSE